MRYAWPSEECRKSDSFLYSFRPRGPFRRLSPASKGPSFFSKGYEVENRIVSIQELIPKVLEDILERNAKSAHPFSKEEREKAQAQIEKLRQKNA